MRARPYLNRICSIGCTTVSLSSKETRTLVWWMIHCCATRAWLTANGLSGPAAVDDRSRVGLPSWDGRTAVWQTQNLFCSLSISFWFFFLNLCCNGNPLFREWNLKRSVGLEVGRVIRSWVYLRCYSAVLLRCLMKSLTDLLLASSSSTTQWRWMRSKLRYILTQLCVFASFNC